jgi:hypothetical protein
MQSVTKQKNQRSSRKACRDKGKKKQRMVDQHEQSTGWSTQLQHVVENYST